MTKDQELLDQLAQLLYMKKSKKFYADKLGLTEDDITHMLIDVRKRMLDRDLSTYLKENIEDEVIKFEEDVAKGTGELIFNSKDEIRTLDELIEKCKIDTDKWDVIRYVQNYWGNNDYPHWQVKAWLGKKSNEQVFQDKFIEFLSSYSPVAGDIPSPKTKSGKYSACLIINKQDAHLNKYDTNGENFLLERFSNILEKTETIVNQAEVSNNLENIVYILGSDEFNSEWMGTTTKGTIQENILTYHTAFEYICNHEVDVITMLLQHSRNIEIVFVPGNHDEYAGWHLVNWLKTYFRQINRISFDISPKYRKYVSYGSTAIMFNHGDAIKPEKLAGIFPIEYKEEWSQHEHFIIMTGDKHSELSQDFNGIKFYRLPALTTATSKWEDKNGFVGAKAEVNGFLIDEKYGITNIFKQYL